MRVGARVASRTLSSFLLYCLSSLLFSPILSLSALTSVRALMRRAREADVLVLPTPPFPVTKIILGGEPGASSAEDSMERGDDDEEDEEDVVVAVE